VEQSTPVASVTKPPTPVSSSIAVNQSYSTFSSPSIQPNSPSSKRLFGSDRKSSKTNIPLLSPPASE
jgi:hypothetical protein